jgi:hypothetical protein
MGTRATNNGGDTCYACDAPGTTREHVPPECIFPESKDTLGGVDLRRNLITVPSCADHNLRKGADDTYFMWVMCCNLPANSVALRQIETKLARALRRDATLFAAINVDPKDVEVIESHSGRKHDGVQLTLDGPRFDRVLQLVARGLFRHHYAESWRGPVRVVPDFIDYLDDPDPKSLKQARVTMFDCAEQLFAGETRHGENPDVFWFKVRGPEAGYRCLMRFAFFGACTATAFFGGEAQG